MNLPLPSSPLFHAALNTEAVLAEPTAAGFGPTYGNRLASARMLRDRWLDLAELARVAGNEAEAGASLSPSASVSPP